MTVIDTQEIDHGLLTSLLADETFWPAEPKTLAETGLEESLVESLVCKHLLVGGTCSGRKLSAQLALPFQITEKMLGSLRTRQVIVHAGSAPFNDYYYSLTERGRQYAQSFQRASSYVGPAPVPLMDYVISVEAQAISAETVRREQLEAALQGVSVDAELFELLGPAVNSGAGMFLYGAPGNGKSTLARRLTICFGQEIWIPRVVSDDGQLIKLFDTSYHQEVEMSASAKLRIQDYDRRWVRIKRPTVVVGGELTMDALEIRHDPRSNLSEAPLQLKSNGGCLLIDDFGRQRVAPAELLNRWIIPLENRHDYLTLSTGKKIQVPFEQLIIFSTNLEPSDLVDEAFLRRIPYKIEIVDPSEEEFHQLFRIYAEGLGFEYNHSAVEHLLARHYRQAGRPLRRCHPRDILAQIKNYCAYHDLPLRMTPEVFDRIAQSYFTLVLRRPGLVANPAVANGPRPAPATIVFDSTTGSSMNIPVGQ